MFKEHKAHEKSIVEQDGLTYFVSHSIDPMVAGGRRAERYSMYNIPLLKSIAVEFDVWFPCWYIPDPTWCLFFQYHHTQSAKKSPPLGFRTWNENIQIYVRNDDANLKVLETPIPIGIKIHFRIESRFSLEPNGATGGYQRIDIDGLRVVEYYGKTYYSDCMDGPYMKYGLYMDKNSNKSVQSMYVSTPIVQG
jgi:Polysaccharide lyase